MKQIVSLFFAMLLCVPSFAQQVVTSDYDLSAEYNKCMKLKKTGVAGIVVFGATWLAGSAICVAEQNSYINERWQDGDDMDEYLRLYNESKELPAYKRGVVMSAVGCIGTGVSIFLTAKYGTKAKRIRNSQGDIVATLGMDLGPQGASLKLTF